MNIANADNIYSLEELAVMYPRQWLSVEVVERDTQNAQPVRVKVIARELNVYAVRDQVGKCDFCTLCTGPIPEVNYVGMF